MSKRALLTLFAFILPLVTVSTAAAPINITFSQTVTNVRTGQVDDDREDDFSLAFGTRSLSATVGEFSSTTDINWVDTGTGALFDFDFDLSRSGLIGSFASSRTSRFNFIATADVSYEFSGMYAVESGGSGHEIIISSVSLLDRTNSNFLFIDNEKRIGASGILNTTVGVADMLGLESVFQGNPAGNLIEGHHYQVFFDHSLMAPRFLFQQPDGGAKATGCVTLSIGGATGAGSCGSISVPEPATLRLLGLGLAVMGFSIRKKNF